MEKGKKYVCKPRMMDCVGCRFNEFGSFCFSNNVCTVPFAIVQDEKILEWLPEEEKYNRYKIGVDKGSEEGDKSAQIIIDIEEKKITSKEKLRKEIEQTKKDLKQKEKDLYELENKLLFDNMEQNVGKCFAKKNPGTGNETIIRVEGIDRASQCYKITRVNYESFLIGWYNITISYETLFYILLNDNDWEEISEAQFVARGKMNIAFAEKEITKNQEK